jgi:hypothetical protein
MTHGSGPPIQFTQETRRLSGTRILKVRFSIVPETITTGGFSWTSSLPVIL